MFISKSILILGVLKSKKILSFICFLLPFIFSIITFSTNRFTKYGSFSFILIFLFKHTSISFIFFVNSSSLFCLLNKEISFFKLNNCSLSLLFLIFNSKLLIIPSKFKSNNLFFCFSIFSICFSFFSFLIFFGFFFFLFFYILLIFYLNNFFYYL